MARKNFEFVKDYPQGGHKVGDRIKLDIVPFYLREYLSEVVELLQQKDPEELIKSKPAEEKKKEKTKKTNSKK